MTETPAEGDGLRPLSGEEASLIARHPLPQGVPDALVNKAQLAHALGVSEVTVSNWIRRGLPFEQEGANGRSYQFRLALAHAWNCQRQADDKARSAEAEAAAEQLKMALVGEDGLGIEPGLSAREQREILELQHAHAVAARDRGELIRRADVVAGFEETFAAIRDALDALPDRLARELGLEGRDLERIETACDDALAGAARRVEEVIGDAKGDDDLSG